LLFDFVAIYNGSKLDTGGIVCCLQLWICVVSNVQPPVEMYYTLLVLLIYFTTIYLYTAVGNHQCLCIFYFKVLVGCLGD